MNARSQRARIGGWVSIWAVPALLWGVSLQAPAQDERSYFVGENGVPILTNRPSRYRSSDDYIEVAIEFEPIYVPGRYEYSMGRGSYTAGDIVRLVRRNAQIQGLDPNLIFAIIRAESGFDPRALSTAGACGLMQLMPATAIEMDVTDIYDCAQNITAGTQYLSKLLQLFDNDLTFALAAYNAGPGTVKKYGGVPPYKETQDYIKRVKRFTDEYDRGVAEVYLKEGNARRTADYLPANHAPYVVHFSNGSSQPAEEIHDRPPHYVIVSAGRQYTILKSLVRRIDN